MSFETDQKHQQRKQSNLLPKLHRLIRPVKLISKKQMNKYKNLNSRNEIETYERKIDKESNIIII